MTARAEKKSVDEAAAREVAQMGFEAAEKEEESREALMARLEKSTDEKERWDLSARINAMDAAI